MTNKPTKLSLVAAALDDMRATGVIGDYAVGGAVAAAFYAQPLNTVDLDIFFTFEPIYDYVRAHGFEYDKDFIFIGSWPVQFIESSHDPLWSEGLKNARKIRIDNGEIAVLPPEHLAAMWVQAGREKDIRKISVR